MRGVFRARASGVPWSRRLCWTRDIGAGLRTAHAIEAGWVQVNQGGGQVPGISYGGYKQSGIGREFSLEGMLDSFTRRKSVTVNLAVRECRLSA